MARPERFELPTTWFETKNSNLSRARRLKRAFAIEIDIEIEQCLRCGWIQLAGETCRAYRARIRASSSSNRRRMTV
jgi:hypothetical protein